MREQTLDIQGNGRRIVLINRINIDEIIKSNYLDRMDNPGGWTKGKTLQKISSIPIDMLMNDEDGRYYLEAGSGTPEATLAHRRFLEKYPEYRTSEVRI